MGGTQRLSFKIASELVRRGHEVNVYTSSARSSKPFEIVQGIRIHRFPIAWFGTTRPWYPSPEVIPAILAEALRGIDIIHTFHFVTYHALLGTIVGRLMRIPVVLTASYHPWKGVYEQTLGLAVLRSANVVVAQCDQERDELRQWIGSEKIHQIPCGIDPKMYSFPTDVARFRREHRIGENDRLVLYVGNFGGRKSILSLVRVMQWVLVSVPNAKLLLIGDGTGVNGIVKLAQKLGILDHLVILVHVSDEELYAAYRSADVFAFPSLDESFGIALVEAAASGLPIVSTRVGIAPQIVTEGVNGYICETCDSTFAKRLTTVLTERTHEKAARNIRDTIIDKYRWASVADAVEALYKSCREKREYHHTSMSDNGRLFPQ